MLLLLQPASRGRSCARRVCPPARLPIVKEQTAVWYQDRLSVAAAIRVLQCSASGSPQCNGTVEVCLRCKLSGGPNQRAQRRRPPHPPPTLWFRPRETRRRCRPDSVPVTRVPTSSSPLYTQWWRVDERNPAPTMGYLLITPPPPVLPMAPLDLAAILEIPREGTDHGRAQTCGVVKRNSWPGPETHTPDTDITHTLSSPSFVMLLLTSLAHSHQPVCTFAFILSAVEN